MLIFASAWSCIGSGCNPGVEAPAAGADLRIDRLRCEYLEDPLGIDVTSPQLSWVLESPRRNEVQSAYRILVATSARQLEADVGDLWDTGRVISSRSTQVTYEGRALLSRARAFWKVQVWDGEGRPSAWSAVSRWEMGLLSVRDWRARWIGTGRPLAGPFPAVPEGTPWIGPSRADPAPYLRKEFRLTKPVASARAYVCGLGFHELYVNGSRVDDRVLDPAFTRYDRRVLYTTYDVTELLADGPNAIGAVLGNGWYNVHSADTWGFHHAPWRNTPRLLCQLHVVHPDGSETLVVSDSTWVWTTGPILLDGIRNGELYDARLERKDWNLPGAAGPGWLAAALVEPPAGVLRAQMQPPITVTETLQPVALTAARSGAWVFDFGRSLAGWARVRVRGPAGTRLVLRYGERLAGDGTVDASEIGKFLEEGPFQTDCYILAGLGPETWEPSFAYHGFRYVEVTGFPDRPTLQSLDGRAVRTRFTPIGSFSSADTLLDAIRQLATRSYGNNFVGIPTDCPHREKLGWTADGHLAAEQAMLFFDNTAAYRQWVRDILDEQQESGALPGIVPTPGWGYAWGNGPAWDSALFIVPWLLHVYCGETRLLEECAPAFDRYLTYLASSDYWTATPQSWLGDWQLVRDRCPDWVIFAAYHHVDLRIAAATARLLGREAKARQYDADAERLRATFASRFFDPGSIEPKLGQQAALAAALTSGLVEPARAPAVVERLVANIESKGGHLDCGIHGAKFLLPALTEFGRADEALRVVRQRTFPGWGHWLASGATSLWEDWRGRGSLDHVYTSDVIAWFQKSLAGIVPDPSEPGFQHLIFRPEFGAGLGAACGATNSMRGKVASCWVLDAAELRWQLAVPVGSRATVHLPAVRADLVRESGSPLTAAAGVSGVSLQSGHVVVEIGSGAYDFRVRVGDE